MCDANQKSNFKLLSNQETARALKTLQAENSEHVGANLYKGLGIEVT